MQNDVFPAVPPPASSDEDRMDELYAVLSHQRRRVILREVHAADGILALDELVQRIIRQEGRGPTDGDSAADAASIRLSLHHTHLPKLTGANLVEYNEWNRTVELSTLPGEQ